ncbi:hypothetical protein GPALN_004077 [Globodera pallida]|nr:hypothetical protein GPALN_004077 [Globodera pallida]
MLLEEQQEEEETNGKGEEEKEHMEEKETKHGKEEEMTVEDGEEEEEEEKKHGKTVEEEEEMEEEEELENGKKEGVEGTKHGKEEEEEEEMGDGKKEKYGKEEEKTVEEEEEMEEGMEEVEDGKEEEEEWKKDGMRNKARAVIARGEASNLPIASGMNQIKWKRSLASEAVKLLGTNQNRPVNILDLEVVHLIAGGYGQGADAADYGKQQNGDDEQQSSGYGYRNRDYEATDVLLMTVKNYLEMFMGQKGLNCDVNSCKATCKVPKRNRELIYDHTHSIGCAVHFETKRKTELRGKLVCIMSTQHGHKKMLHHHNVFKVGSACSNCERNFTCNAKSRLCVKRDEERRRRRPPNVRGTQRRQNAGSTFF